MNYLKALAVFAGTVIGVGIFGLPFVAFKTGFLIVVFYFILMAGIVTVVDLIFGKVALGTKELHRLPGYTELYLGNKWKKFSLLVEGFGLTGALLAYLIVGGEFLTLLFQPVLGGSNLIYTLLFFTAGSYLIFQGIKSISWVELFLLFLFFAIVILFFLKAYPFINLDYLKSTNLNYLALPYGVVLFSLWGLDIVPEIKEMVRKEKVLKKVIISGILLISITYLIFIFTVIGVSGPLTSEEAISGFSQALGDNIVKLGFMFGIITCFTSFLALGLTFKKIFWYDFNLSPGLSWFIACFLPLFLFLMGFNQFIAVIGLTGAVALGLEGLIVVFLYHQFLKQKFSQKMNFCLYILPIFFLLGVLFEIFYFLK